MPQLFSPSENYLTRIRKNGYSQGLPTSTFADNFTQALNIGIYEDMSNSRNLVMSNHKSKRMQNIIEANRNGTLPDEMLNRFRTKGPGWSGVNAHLLAVYSKDHPEYGLDIPTDDEILEGIRDDLKIVKTSYAELQRRAGAGGKIGGFMGMSVPYMIDPVLMPAWFVGYGQAATGAKMLAGVGRVVGVEAGLETVSQIFQYQWKDEVSEASLRESITSIAMVAGLVAGIGVTAIGLSKGLKKLLDKAGVNTDEIGKNWLIHKAKQAADEMGEAEFSEEFIVAAVVKDTEGNIYKAPTHHLALEELDRVSGKTYQRGSGDLFVTSEERVLTREEAVKLTGEQSEDAVDIIGHAIRNKDVKALDFARGLRDQDKRLNEPFRRTYQPVYDHKGNKIVTSEEIKQAGKEFSAKARKAKEAFDKEEVRNVTQVPKGDDPVVDAGVEQILKENPDIEIPVLETVEEGVSNLVQAKATKVFKDLVDKTELANKYKECLV